MTINRRAIKAAAREQIRTANPRPVYEGVLYALISAAFLFLTWQILSSRLGTNEMYLYMSYLLNGEIGTLSYARAAKLLEQMHPTMVESLIFMGLALFHGLVSAGFSLFALRSLRRDESCSLWNLFDSFSVFLPLLLLLILKRLLMTIWLRLLVFPALFAFYRYRLAVYLVLDHPGLGGFRALLVSSGMMHGHMGQLLLLDLSFAGWFLLALLPFSLASMTASAVIWILGALGSAALYGALASYHRLSCTIFYQQLCQDAEKTIEQ